MQQVIQTPPPLDPGWSTAILTFTDTGSQTAAVIDAAWTVNPNGKNAYEAYQGSTRPVRPILHNRTRNCRTLSWRFALRQPQGTIALVLRLFPLLVLVIAISLTSTIPAHAAGTDVVLSGGDLPYAIKLARGDADAFVRRVSPPPKLEDAPVFQGNGYKIASAYWDEVLRNGRDDRGAAALDAFYFEQGGYVVAHQDGRDVWLVLDLRQRAIIDRYLALGRARTIRGEPGILEVLTIASRSETVGVEIGGVALDEAQRNNFWSLIAIGPRATHTDPPQVPLGARGVWIVFALEEGRSLQVFYERQSALFIDSFGAEIYGVSTPMATLIDTIVPRTSTGIRVAQEKSTGSPIWWLIAGGGGIACIGAAVWLQRWLAKSK